MKFAIVWEKMMSVVGISKLGSVLQVSHDNMSHVPGSHIVFGFAMSTV